MSWEDATGRGSAVLSAILNAIVLSIGALALGFVVFFFAFLGLGWAALILPCLVFAGCLSIRASMRSATTGSWHAWKMPFALGPSLMERRWSDARAEG